MTRTKSDSEIQQDVLRELKWDTRVEETEIGVTVNNGIVTLTGIVGSYGKRMASTCPFRAAIAFSARYSCLKPSSALSATMTAMAAASL